MRMSERAVAGRSRDRPAIMDALLLHWRHFLRVLYLRLINVIGLSRWAVVGLLRLVTLPIGLSWLLLCWRRRLVVWRLLLRWLVIRRLLLRWLVVRWLLLL